MRKPNTIENYLDAEGRVTRWAGRKHFADQPLILSYLADKFEVGREYTEREINATLKQWHTFEDWALLRRELFEQGYFNRVTNGTRYWRTPSVKLY
jgi:hypothetical protein